MSLTVTKERFLKSVLSSKALGVVSKHAVVVCDSNTCDNYQWLSLPWDNLALSGMRGAPLHPDPDRAGSAFG
jgi:hypothetical protein